MGASQVGPQATREYLARIQERYERAGQDAKGGLLDEIREVTVGAGSGPRTTAASRPPQTKINESLAPLWGDAKSLHWTSDTFHVPDGLLYPRGVHPAKKCPLVVPVHGGPSAAR